MRAGGGGGGGGGAGGSGGEGGKEGGLMQGLRCRVSLAVQNLYAGAQLCRGAAGRESGQWISEAASNMHAHSVHINGRSKQWRG